MKSAATHQGSSPLVPVATAQEKGEVLELALEQADMGAWSFDPETGGITIDENLKRMLRLEGEPRNYSGLPFFRMVHGEDRERMTQALRGARRLGDTISEKFRFCDPTGRTMLLMASGKRIAAENGSTKLIGVMSDATGRHRQDMEFEQLVRDVDHRVRNLVSVILSVFQSTSRSAATLEEFSASFATRLESIARVQGALLLSRWTSIDLQALVRIELEAHDVADRVNLKGPEITLPAYYAQPIGMLIHELLSNARRHGALSRPEGRIDIELGRKGDFDQRVCLKWSENQDAPAPEPSNTGFGMVVLEKMIPEQLGADVEIDWGKTGAVFNFAIPVHPEAANDIRPPQTETTLRTRLDHSRLEGTVAIVVDDEWLLAEQNADVLERAGVDVIGTFTSVEDARGCNFRRLDFAVLDFAMNDESIVDLADALRQAGVPIVFVSGYDLSERLPERMADEIVIAKPAGEIMLLDGATAAAARKRGE